MTGTSLNARRVARLGSVAALVSSLLLPAAAKAGPPSQILEEHLIAQAGLSIGLGLNQAGHFFNIIEALGGASCKPVLGGIGFIAAIGGAGGEAAVLSTYYDPGCRKPYLTESAEVTIAAPNTESVVYTSHFVSLTGAIQGDLSLAQDISTAAGLATLQVDRSGTGAITYSDNSKALITDWTLSD